MTELVFKGKEFVYNHHLAVPTRPLVPHPEKGVGEPSLDGNLIIHGDNLHALKALLPLYAGKVDCVFIDPPYNTGNEGWVYNDNVNSPMIKEWLGKEVGLEDGLRHDKWCAMMWPRLRLLHELLAEDGIIFICIDDGELSRLIGICQEIFGEENHMATFVWRSRTSEDTRNTVGASVDHEYVVSFSKNRMAAFLGSEIDIDKFSNPDNDPRGPWRSSDLTGLATKEQRPNLHYDLINPETGINYGCPERGWRYDKEKMYRKISDNRIIWPKNPNGRPRHKLFLYEIGNKRKNVSTWVDGHATYMGTRELSSILGNRIFDFPKPSSLVEFFISQHPNKNAIVLDSFAGSGTTAHAVLEANKRDGGNRKFILVECEDYADSLTAERVRRVIRGYAFTGTQKTELLRKKLTWSALKKADQILHEVEGLENLHEHEFDNIRKTVKDGELVVVGEKKVEERVEGLGGSFTFCTLGEPIDLDRILTGEQLPGFEQLGAVLFHMAAHRAADTAAMDAESGYLGETEEHVFWLIYKPDLEWLKSAEAALTLQRARQIAASNPQKKHIVFAAARFVSRKLLAEEKLPVEFAPLPYALFRIERD